MQPKKAPIMKHIIVEKQSKEDATSSVHKSNTEDKGQKATSDEPEVIVYVPSCKRFGVACEFSC
jgi:hypothetical protein